MGSELAKHARVEGKMQQWDEVPGLVVLRQLVKERVQELGCYCLGVVPGENEAADSARQTGDQTAMPRLEAGRNDRWLLPHVRCREACTKVLADGLLSVLCDHRFLAATHRRRVGHIRRLRDDAGERAVQIQGECHGRLEPNLFSLF